MVAWFLHFRLLYNSFIYRLSTPLYLTMHYWQEYKKLRAILIASLLFSFLAAPVAAKELVIGFVDVPRLIDQSPQSVAAGERLEKEFAPRQNSLKASRAKLESLSAKLEKEALVMSASERDSLELRVRKLERDLKRDEQDFREELNIKKNNEFKKVREIVLKAILEFSKEHNYDLILSEGVVFAHKRVDVTDQIIKIMRSL